MLRSLNELIGYHIHSKNNEQDLGKIKDVYFDDTSWMIRYFVVDTRPWLSGRKVLIARLFLEDADWASRTLSASLTEDDLQKAPSLEQDEPVSRQMEQQVREHYQLTPYWSMPTLGGPVPATGSATLATARERHTSDDPNLRSLQEVCGYHIQAKDDQIGHVENLIVQDGDWHIRYMVVDTRNWLPGQKVLVALDWIDNIGWAEKKVYVDLDSNSVKGSPRYNPATPINREYEARLYDFYGRPCYWE